MKFVVRSIAVAAVAFCAFGAHAQKGETVKIAWIDPASSSLQKSTARQILLVLNLKWLVLTTNSALLKV